MAQLKNGGQPKVENLKYTKYTCKEVNTGIFSVR